MIPSSSSVSDAPIDTRSVRGAQVLMGCEALEPNLAFFIDRLGFRLDAIFPADAPRTAMVSGYGLQLRLVVGADRGAQVIYLLCDDPQAAGHGHTELLAPNGVAVRLVAANPRMAVPPTQQSLVLTQAGPDAHWGVGRAGLMYRDLIPDRHGGAFIASHIRVLEGGPVPDYVHFHKIRFQAIFCRKGWIRVAYEDQGEPLIMRAGDCVLQPPEIRHRVLESSAGAEVVELGAPAEHVTMPDHALDLSHPPLDAQREFGGQRFVHHVAAQAHWQPWRIEGFEVSDTGIGEATHGLAGIRVVRPAPQHALAPAGQSHDTEFCFYFVLSGSVQLQVGGASHALGEDDSISIPADTVYALSEPSADLQLIEVTLPDRFATQRIP